MTATVDEAGAIRAFRTRFPPGGDPARYVHMAEQLQVELWGLDQALDEVIRRSGARPLAANLDGRFAHSMFMRIPADPLEFESYHQAQQAGGVLEGGRMIRQLDAMPGTRYATVVDAELFHAATARMYAYQVIACARGRDPLTPEGMALGAQWFWSLSPDARLFVQVAAVYQGDLLDGPDALDNRRLQRLLTERGHAALAKAPGVGAGDIQTAGAVTVAMEKNVALNDLVGFGAVGNLNRYQRVLGHVVDGSFNQALGRYDLFPPDEPERWRRSACPVVAQFYGHIQEQNPALRELKRDPVVRAFYSLFDLDGDGRIAGPELQAMISNVCDLVNLMLSGATPGSNAPAALYRFHRSHDLDWDGLYTVDEIRWVLSGFQTVLEVVQLECGAEELLPVLHQDGPVERCPVLSSLRVFTPAASPGKVAANGEGALDPGAEPEDELWDEEEEDADDEPLLDSYDSL